MMTLREQFTAQKERARIVSQFTRGTVIWVCLLRYPDGQKHISVIGNSIGWGSADVWRMRGIRVRKVCAYVLGKPQLTIQR